jgi:hypothetical protein
MRSGRDLLFPRIYVQHRFVQSDHPPFQQPTVNVRDLNIGCFDIEVNVRSTRSGSMIANAMNATATAAEPMQNDF